MKDYKCSPEEVLSILASSRQLQTITSSFNNEELLLENPKFIKNLIVENTLSSNNDSGDKLRRQVLAELRSLLQRSKEFNFDNNTASDIFFSKTTQDDQCEEKNSKQLSSISSVIKWFPWMALHQIQTHSNALTYKIENISPSDDYDVVLTKDKKFVIKWRSCSSDIKNILIPVTKETHPGKLQKLTPPMEKKAFYGLTFDSKFQNMYTIENCKEAKKSI